MAISYDIKGRVKPCPFCGSRRIRLLPQSFGLTIDCEICSATIKCISRDVNEKPIIPDSIAKKMIITSWNNRLDADEEDKKR